jgi:hypothetical protein
MRVFPWKNEHPLATLDYSIIFAAAKAPLDCDLTEPENYRKKQ